MKDNRCGIGNINWRVTCDIEAGHEDSHHAYVHGGVLMWTQDKVLVGLNIKELWSPEE